MSVPFLVALWQRFLAWGKSWEERRLERIAKTKPTYDAYPDVPSHPKVRVMLVSGRFMEQVDLEGYSLEQINWQKEFRQRWYAKQTVDALIRLIRRVEAAEAARKEGT